MNNHSSLLVSIVSAYSQQEIPKSSFAELPPIYNPFDYEGTVGAVRKCSNPFKLAKRISNLERITKSLEICGASYQEIENPVRKVYEELSLQKKHAQEMMKEVIVESLRERKKNPVEKKKKSKPIERKLILEEAPYYHSLKMAG